MFRPNRRRPDRLMDHLVEKVSDYCLRHQLLFKEQPVVVGVSGGADSLALLQVLSVLQKSIGFELVAAHLNHGLRGDTAEQDQAFVADWCDRLGLRFECRTTDVRNLSREQGISLEDAGRTARLDFFQTICDELDFGQAHRMPASIALAHHINDQAETLVMHLGRGSGLDGLVGIQPRNGRLIRPFLDLSRFEIEDYLTRLKIAWQSDETNLEPFALRNRIRHQVMPAWQGALGYDPAMLLGRCAKILGEDKQLLDQLTADAAADCLQNNRLLCAQWLLLHPALQSRVIRQYWRLATGSPKTYRLRMSG